ncbi:replication initiation protein, partial [Escherichia coli]|nr:replication initiation protein [Escherichia coli]
AKLPYDEQRNEIARFILKRMPPDEAYWCTKERLEQLVARDLRQLELALTASPPH